MATDNTLKTAADVEAQLKSQWAQDEALLALGWQTELALLQRLMASSFIRRGSSSSIAYQDGARQMFMQKLDLKPRCNPFEPGIAQHDAWQAGVMHAKAAHLSYLAQGL